MVYDPRVRLGTTRRALLISTTLAAVFCCFGARARPARANGRFPEAQRLLEHPGDPNRLYLAATFGLLVTEDRGKNWYTICEQAFALRFLEGDPLLEIMPDGALLGGIYETLNRSSDCGCTWQTTLGASAKETIIDITIDRSRGSVLALVQDSTTFPSRFGVHESTDWGKTWRKLSDLPVEIVGAFTIDVAPSDSTRVYVTGVPTTVAGMAPDSVLAVSTDHGVTWERRAIAGVPAGAAPYIAAVDPTNPDHLYARTDEWDDSAYFSANDALLYSDDGGRSWRELARHSAKLFGFALSPDGKTVLIGYGDPVDAGGRTTNSDDFGIYRASTSNFNFEKVFVAAINGLRWTSTGLYALITENHPERPTPGMSLGFSATAGFTLATPNPFVSLLSVKNVRGPLACQATVCGGNWKDGTPDVAPLCDLLQASCDVDAAANVLSCPAPADGGAGGSGGGGGSGVGGAAGGTGGSSGAAGRGGGAGGGGGGSSGCGCSAAAQADEGRAGYAGLLAILAVLLLRRRRPSQLFITLLVAGAGGLAAVGCGGDGGPMIEPLPDCENRGDQFFAGIAKTSDDGAATVQIISAAPAPPANSYTNEWQLLVTDAGGAPIDGALVIAAPYMVDHGHGAPNVIASEAADGAYLIDPLSLKMNGLWDVTMKVTPAGGAESRVVFSFCVLPM